MTAASVAKLLRFGSMLSGSPFSALIVISWAPDGSAAVACVGLLAGAAVGAAAAVVGAPAAAGVATAGGVETVTLLPPPPPVVAGGWAEGPHALATSAKTATVENK